MTVRKIGAPHHVELAIGAVASGGLVVLNDDVIRQLGVGDDELDRRTAVALGELAEQERRFRGDRPMPPLGGRTVVLVDDGLATGATMRAAVRAVRTAEPDAIVVAVPGRPARHVRRARRHRRRPGVPAAAGVVQRRRAVVRRLHGDHRRRRAAPAGRVLTRVETSTATGAGGEQRGTDAGRCSGCADPVGGSVGRRRSRRGRRAASSTVVVVGGDVAWSTVVGGAWSSWSVATWSSSSSTSWWSPARSSSWSSSSARSSWSWSSQERAADVTSSAGGPAIASRCEPAATSATASPGPRAVIETVGAGRDIRRQRHRRARSARPPTTRRRRRTGPARRRSARRGRRLEPTPCHRRRRRRRTTTAPVARVASACSARHRVLDVVEATDAEHGARRSPRPARPGHPCCAGRRCTATRGG